MSGHLTIGGDVNSAAHRVELLPAHEKPMPASVVGIGVRSRHVEGLGI